MARTEDPITVLPADDSLISTGLAARICDNVGMDTAPVHRAWRRTVRRPPIRQQDRDSSSRFESLDRLQGNITRAINPK